MRITQFSGLLVPVMCIGVVGCFKVEPDTAPGSAAPGQPGIGAHVQRGREKRSLENEMKQLGIFMTQYVTEFGSPPKSWQEFKPYIQRDANRLVAEIEGQEIHVFWGSPMNSTTIIAYEVNPDLRGTHLALRGDGGVVTMTAADLKTALQGRGR